MSLKPDASDTLQISKSRLQNSTANINKLHRWDEKSPENHSSTLLPNSNAQSREKKLNKIPNDENMAQLRVTHSPVINSKTGLNINDTNAVARNGDFSREKSSSVCNIQ